MTSTALRDPDAPTEAAPQLPHILTAIRAIMNEVRGVAKAGEFKASTAANAQVRYRFQKYDDMAAALGAAFREQGVMIQGKIVSLDITEWDKSKDGGLQRNCRVVLRKVFIFTSLMDGTHVEIEATGEGADNSDKAANKAETGAIKNALKQAFLLSTGDDDPDDTRHDDTGRPVVVNDPWQQAERVVQAATQPQAQAPTVTRDQQEKAHKALAAIPLCATTGDLDKLREWASGWNLLSVPVDGVVLGARLIAAKGTLPAGPPTHVEQATRPAEYSGDRDE
jgi:hypothetical protein